MGYWGVGAERGVVSPPPMPGLDLQEEMVASGNNYYPRPGSRSPIAMQASGGYDLPPHQYQRDDAEMCNNDFEPSRSHYGLRVDSLGFDNGQAGVGVGVNHFRGF